MRYFLRKRVLALVPRVDIDAATYARYKAARSVLSNGIALEEKYEILISNYLEFETTVLEKAAADMVRDHVDYADFFDVRLALNRRIVNLLTSARLYLDQLPQHVDACTHDTEAWTRIKKVISSEYDEHREYRFMDALRNYTQHRGIPIHWISHSGSWVGTEEEGKRLQYSLNLVSEASILREDADFKAKVLAELDERTDLVLFARQYVECLSTVHEAVRDVVREALSRARELMQNAHNIYLAAGADDVIGLCACAYEDQEEIEVEFTALLLDWDDVRVALQKRNRRLVNLHRRYVTGESTFKDAKISSR